MKKIAINNLLLILISVLMILSMANAVDAWATLSLDETTKSVPVGGTVDFIVTLRTNDTFGTINWNIAPADPITAKWKVLSGSGLVDGSQKSGTITTAGMSTDRIFKLTVTAGNGAVIGQKYLVDINYCTGVMCTNNAAIAIAEAGVIPTPELSPSILTAIGLIGLIGLVRMRRKD